MKTHYIERKIKQAVDSGKKAAKKSANDLIIYAEEHPIQSAVIGAIVFWAIKRFITKTLKLG